MIKFPFMNGQQLNLDWIMQQLRAILNFIPMDQGAVGDVLQRGTNGAKWQPLTSVVYDIDGMDTAAEVTASDEIPIYDVSAQGNYKATVQDILDLSPVSSVNGKTGTVVLDASDVGALPDDYTPPAAPVSSVNGKTGTVVLSASDVGALPDNYTPPAAPVSSVNGKTGTVVLSASDVGALPSTYTAPVTSVNGQTGAVTINTTTGWGNPSDITSSFPFTPAADGFIYGYIVAASSGSAYVYFQEDGNGYWRCGTYSISAGICFPVRAGHQYSINAEDNISSKIINYIPFA